MANEYITQLPTTANATFTDIVYAVQNYVSPSNLGLSVQETWQQVYDLFNNQMIQSYAGNPNGYVAGTEYSLCWDTTDNLMWVCTTTGNAAGASWTLISGKLVANGQLLIGNSSGIPVPATLTNGANISITNGPGTITIAATGSAGFTWTATSGPSVPMTINNGYIATGGSLVTFQTPASAPVGSVFQVAGQGTGLWSIITRTGQNIQIGSASSTTTTGSVSSANAHDSVTLVCIVADTTFSALGGPQTAGLTIT